MKKLTTLLVLWSIQYVAAECASEDYYENGIVICSGEGLKKMPEGLNHTLEVLDLSYNSIREISDGTFTNMTQIKEIDLSYNNITELKVALFEHLTSLEEIDLSYNMLVTLPNDIFINNLKLKRCYVKNNLIKFPEMGPILKSTSLKYLDLSFCNITSLSSDALSELPLLEELNLKGNCIPELQCNILTNLNHLKQLNLDCISCNSTFLQNQCNVLHKTLSSCSRTLIGEALLPLVKGSVALGAVIAVILISVSCVVCFKIWRIKKVVKVRMRSSKLKSQSSLQDRPLPKLPHSNDVFESPVTPHCTKGNVSSVKDSIPTTNDPTTKGMYEYIQSSKDINNSHTPFIESSNAIHDGNYVIPFLNRNESSHDLEMLAYETIEPYDRSHKNATDSLSSITSHTSRTSTLASAHAENENSREVYVTSAFLLVDEDRQENNIT